jgi:hypothetical protein
LPSQDRVVIEERMDTELDTIRSIGDNPLDAVHHGSPSREKEPNAVTFDCKGYLNLEEKTLCKQKCDGLLHLGTVGQADFRPFCKASHLSLYFIIHNCGQGKKPKNKKTKTESKDNNPT